MKYYWPHLNQINKEVGASDFDSPGFDTAVVMDDTSGPAVSPAGLGSLAICISSLLWPQVLQKPVCFQLVCPSIQKD